MNYIDDFHREWPMPRLDRYRIQIIFHDHLDSIFQKKDGNEKCTDLFSVNLSFMLNIID